MWLIILLLGVCSPHWTTGTEIERDNLIITIVEKDGNIKSLVSVKAAAGPNNNDSINVSGLEVDAIESGAFSGLTDAKSLNLEYNKLKELNLSLFSNLPNLEEISVGHNYITKFYGSLVGSRNLKYFNISDNNITDLTESNFEGLTESEIIMGKNRIWTLNGSYPGEIHKKIQHMLPWAFIVKMFEISQWPLRFDSAPIFVKLCKTDDDTVESVKVVANEKSFRNCLSIDTSNNESILSIHSQLGKFQRGWYQIPKKFIGLALSINSKIGITPELLNDLPESITTVILNLTSLKTIERDIIDNKFLKVLDIGENSLENIEAGAFEKTNLEFIDFSANHLSSIAFVKTLPASLKQLILNENRISEIPEDCFVNLKALEYLEIERNQLTHLPVGVFRGLKELSYINIAFNHVQKLEAGIFDDNEKLTMFNARKNSIVELEDGVFTNTKRLAAVELSENKIQMISRNTFEGLKNRYISSIYLTRNSIDTIEEGSFANMTIDHLDLDFWRIAITNGAFKYCKLGKVHSGTVLDGIFAECTTLIQHHVFYKLELSYVTKDIYLAHPNAKNGLLVYVSDEAN